MTQRSWRLRLKVPSIFEFVHYKAYLRAWIGAHPKRGRGLVGKLADHLGISSTMMSHILNGDKNLSLEAVDGVGTFIGLSDPEFDYFLLLVLHEKAGSHALKEKLKKRIQRERDQERTVDRKMRPDVELSEAAKATFYSSWIYSGIRNCSACPGTQTVDEIAARLKLKRASVATAVEFLVAHRLCVLGEDGLLAPGPQQTHVAETSPLACQHHRNWRLQAAGKVLERDKEDLFFTGPMSLSERTADEVRGILLEAIAQIRDRVRPSPSEAVRCLNIDWFRY